MKFLHAIAFALSVGAAALAFAGTAAEPPKPIEQSASVSAQEVNQQWIIEGEKRYRINCGRCHQPPRTFSPRVMSTAVRHMRVRGMLTEQDMKYVLYYMTH